MQNNLFRALIRIEGITQSSNQKLLNKKRLIGSLSRQIFRRLVRILFIQQPGKNKLIEFVKRETPFLITFRAVVGPPFPSSISRLPEEPDLKAEVGGDLRQIQAPRSCRQLPIWHSKDAANPKHPRSSPNWRCEDCPRG